MNKSIGVKLKRYYFCSNMANRMQQAKATCSASSSSTLSRASGSISRSSSSSSSSQSGSSPKPVSKRMCAQCQNHGLKEPVRGHKRHCKYRLCNCKNCLLVKERQRIVALHLYVRRAQQQEEDAAEAAAAALKEAIPSMQASGSPLLSNPDFYRAMIMPDCQHSNSVAAAAVTSGFLTADGENLNKTIFKLKTRKSPFSAEKQRNNLMFEDLLKLRDRYQIPDAAMALLLCVLKISGSVEDASKIIQEGMAFS
ncbi:Hypothetical predicted protein [Cloeon dipterum]|uniref:DM domain-containing protein n=1 Tax=Cloeon dipterum TaxID=197152 RepID=A0A8S1C4L8_9INSE|nr:Hypothetical predicted protein [Cloeon dipterum]